MENFPGQQEGVIKEWVDEETGRRRQRVITRGAGRMSNEVKRFQVDVEFTERGEQRAPGTTPIEILSESESDGRKRRRVRFVENISRESDKRRDHLIERTEQYINGEWEPIPGTKEDLGDASSESNRYKL